jgi:RNA polymerase sigma-70 factor, ECF subfamily
MPPSAKAASLDASSDADLVRRVAAQEPAAFERLMRRHNSRLFRVTRAILRDDAEAEDAVQDAYLSAYRHIDDYRGDASVATWLTRIAVNQALMRLRKRQRDRVVIPFTSGGEGLTDEAEASLADTRTESPSATTFRAEIRRLLEQRIDQLPVAFRTVFVMREIEDMTVEETAEALSIPPATVRTRLFRARSLLREALARDIDMATVDVFGFAGPRCDRIVANVLAFTKPDTPAE